jgi:hypothetical protein
MADEIDQKVENAGLQRDFAVHEPKRPGGLVKPEWTELEPHRGASPSMSSAWSAQDQPRFRRP